MTTSAPLSWVKQIQASAKLCQKVPLFGSSPPFPIDKLKEEIQKKLDLPDLDLHISSCEVISPEEFLSPFGTSPQVHPLQLSPLPGHLSWILSSESMEKLSSLSLSQEETKGFADTRFQEGFYQFLLLQVSEVIASLNTYPDLQIQWLDEKELPKEASLAIDISIKIKDHSLQGRLILSPEFHSAFTEHFAAATFDYASAPAYAEIDVPLALEIGSCLLAQTDFANLHVGDFLILDRCSYDPTADKGTATLTLSEKPCFIVKIKKNSLKILDYAIYHGDLNTMDEEFITDSFEEETPLPTPEEEQNKQEEGKEEEHPAPTEEGEEAPPPAEEENKQEEHAPEPVSTAPPEVLTSPQEIPFPIVIEVERIKMSLEKLLQLTPGNILETTIRPSQGVYLTVHGKKIAKGELVKIGEVLGVKILETGEA